MSYPQELVNSAQIKFFNDQKKILVYLEAHKTFRASHPNADVSDIDAALDIYDTNFKQVGEFLENVLFLAATGFEKPQIRNALVLAGNNRESAMEILLKNT